VESTARSEGRAGVMHWGRDRRKGKRRKKKGRKEGSHFLFFPPSGMDPRT